MRSRYSQITVFVLNAISDVFIHVTYTVIICIKSSKEGFLPLCIINSSTSRKPKYLLHSITMSIELALKIFIRTLVTVNSSDLTYVRFTGHASSAYNKQGKHLSSSKCRTVSSEAELPMFPNIVLKLRKRTFLRGQNNN